MASKPNFSARIIAWQKRHGRHHLPWQRQDAYRVWVSEIMLQQTQVTTVIPYFERFIRRFPDVIALAIANIDEVLHLWSGLGYYSRARNLHQSAREIKRVHHGQFPDTYAALTALPGIGPSTAGAILSLAFNQPAVVLDGNVRRVMSRYLGILLDTTVSAEFKKLWAYAETQLPKRQAQAYSQGLMDLGASVCTRKQPQCQHCPLASDCQAHKNDWTDRIPASRKAKEKPIKTAEFLLVYHGDHVLLKQRPKRGVWAQLWSLPERSDGEGLNWRWIEHQRWATQRAVFSHYFFDYTVTLCQLQRFERESDGWLWYNLKAPPNVGLPKAIQQALTTWNRALHEA